MNPGLKNTLRPDKSQVFHQEQTDGLGLSFAVTVWFPTGQQPGFQKHFSISDWRECGIAWTLMPLMNSEHGSRWKSTDHFSMLPYGWIPNDGADFFTLFILNLKGRWLKLCDQAEVHLSELVSPTPLSTFQFCLTSLTSLYNLAS